jgi:hypothetical protein
MTIAHDNRVEAEPNADGSNDTRWPNGDKPVSGTALTFNASLYAAFGSFLSLPINQTASFNIRSILGGSEAATAAISLVTISGNDAAAGGWAISGDFLVFSGSSANAGGVLEVIATPAHGSAVPLPQSAWSSANPSSDSMAPTSPTGLSITPLQGALQATWDTAGDGYDGSTAGGGVDHYNLYKNSVSAGNKLTPPSPVASAVASAMPRLTFTNIGAFSPSPSATQNKQLWTLVAAGAGFHGVTSDQCAFLGAQMSGDQAVSLTVDAYTSTIQYSPVGIMVRESLAPDSPFIAWYWQPGAGLGLQGKSRDTTGASSSNFVTVPGVTAPTPLMVVRSGTLWTLFYSNGGQWKVGGTKTLAMAQNCQWGAVATSQVAGTAITAVVENINLTANGQVFAIVQTAVPLTLGVTAVDKAGNESAPSILILGSPLPTAGAIKLPLGNGMWTDNQYWTGSTGLPDQERSNFDSYFPIWSANPDIKWFYLSLTLGAIEGPTRGDYSKGFAAIDYVLNKLATAGHRIGLIVEIWQTFFNTTSITDLRAWPQYMINNGWIQSCTEAGANRTQLKWDIDDLWAAENAALVAICDRYDSHPLFYGIASGDESEAISVVDNVTQPANSGLSPGQTIINSAHYCAKYLEQQLLMLSHLPNTLGYVPLNFLPPGDSTTPATMANMINTIEAQYPKHAIYGGPDPFWRQTTFQQLVAGLLPSSGMGDIRHNILIMNRTQERYLGNTGSPPTNPGVTPGQLYDNGVQNNAVMQTWNHENWEFYKYADQAAAIRARNGAVGTPPVGGSYTLV